jgi:hypothetical protein
MTVMPPDKMCIERANAGSTIESNDEAGVCRHHDFDDAEATAKELTENRFV